MNPSERPRWRKSSHSGGDHGNCVELATLRAGRIGMRDSKDPDGGVLTFTRADVAALLAHLKESYFRA
ncbi:DUF397 domain-containing protein [Spirillospora sp. NPDC047279]|uniref:DUF397 domain-containing protein n=1 Tax=Spirillospora sp. NPDC047279 TaxID=3155478 RepID=UPI0034067C88